MKKVVLNYIYLSRKHAGGKDQVGLNLLKGFQENGIAKDIHVICFDYSVDMLRQLAPDAELISIKSSKQGGELKRMLGNMITNTFQVYNIVKKESFDVIYHLDCNNGLRKFKAKSVLIPHDIKAIAHRDLPGLRIPFYKYIMYKIMYAMDFRHADTIVGISDVDKGEIKEYYPKYSDKVVRIYDPIDIPLCKKKVEAREKNIVAINLQFHHKNIITLIKAFERIMNQIEHNLILIGNVPDRVMYLKDYVIEHQLEDRVVFTGFISDDERNHYLENCSLYVAPTLFEGFGMVSVEAMISCVPTLVSKIPTNYEVTQGLCDYYEPAEDVDALANAITSSLYKSRDYETSMAVAKQIYELYNYNIIAKQYWDEFQK